MKKRIRIELTNPYPVQSKGIGKYVGFKDKNGYHKHVIIVSNATSNCQMGVLGEAKQLLTVDKPLDLLLQLFKEKIYKKLVLIDIQEVYVKDFKKIFKKGIISTKRYISSNGSKMCIIIIQNKWS